MAVSPHVQELLGRARELERLEALLDGLPEQGGGALVVSGEAGIGKSALLEAVRESADRRGFAVLQTGGVESEAHLGHAGLHQLLLPVLGELDRLPAPQRSAVGAAFGMRESAAPDAFLIALAALDLLAETAAATPLVVLAEDAHWLDRATRDVLAFVARRVELEPIAVVFTVRDGHDGWAAEAKLPELRLAGLDELSAAELLETVAPELAHDLRDRILDEAAGNPLALLELPRALHAGPAQVSGSELPLPLTDRLRRAFSAQLSELPPTAATPLLVAALDPAGEVRRILRAASELEGRVVGTDALDAAVAARLVVVRESGVRFRHPLVRSAIYQGASLGGRRAAHAALAAAYADDPDRSVWHRAAALVAPDASVVLDLQRAAARARRRGAPASAAAALERAAALTGDPAQRGGLLLEAAELEYELGRHDMAVRELHEARPLVDEQQQMRIGFLLETLEGGWSGADLVPSFVDLAEELRRAGDTQRALQALLTVAMRFWWGNPAQEVRNRVVEVAQRIASLDEPSVLAIVALGDPAHHGRAVLERLEGARAPDSADPMAMFHLSIAAASVWAPRHALPFHAAALHGFRAQGRLALVAQALVHQAWAAVHVGDARVATPTAAEAARLCEETGQPRWTASALLAQATMAAERGDVAGAAELTASAESVLLPMGANPMLSLVQFTRGRAAVAQGRFSDAFAALARVFDPADIAYQPFVGAWGIADFVDAAVHGGGPLAVARAALEEHERLAELSQGPLVRVQVAYVRPLLAGEDEAGARFQEALEDEDLARWPCYRARLLLAYGAWLRRRRRVAESRVPLRAAAEAFDALGFAGMSERARQELRASGETGRPRRSQRWDDLSPQELQIARMAAQGLSNREIGEKLYLSHRTIGSHLYRIFPKLGIASRGQLRDVLETGAHA